MPLDTPGLTLDIKDIAQKMRSKEVDDDDAYASMWAKAIEKFVKSGDVKAGVPVQVAPSTGTGATTAVAKVT